MDSETFGGRTTNDGIAGNLRPPAARGSDRCAGGSDWKKRGTLETPRPWPQRESRSVVRPATAVVSCCRPVGTERCARGFGPIKFINKPNDRDRDFGRTHTNRDNRYHGTPITKRKDKPTITTTVNTHFPNDFYFLVGL